jgi:hypothetical protein
LLVLGVLALSLDVSVALLHALLFSLNHLCNLESA